MIHLALADTLSACKPRASGDDPWVGFGKPPRRK